MIEVVFAVGLTIISNSPPLTPEQAVAVLRGSHSPQDLTDYKGAPPPWVLIGEQHSGMASRPPDSSHAGRLKSKIETDRPGRPLQPAPTVGQCWVGVPCIVGPPTIYVEQVGKH
jgi:hypothetical protein